MDSNKLISEVSDVEQESKQNGVLIQALGPDLKWYNVRKVEHTVYHDLEGASHVAVLMLEEVK